MHTKLFTCPMASSWNEGNMWYKIIQKIFNEYTTYPYEVRTSLLTTVIKPEQIPKKSAEPNRWMNEAFSG